MGWLFAGGVLGIAVRAVFWVTVWYLIGADWYWLPRALVAWIVGDLVANIAMRILGLIR